MSIRRLITLGAAAAGLAASLAACSAGSTATQLGRPDGGAGDRLVVGTVGPPVSLDFTTTGGAAIPQALMGNVYETLVRIDADGEVVPHLATSWEISPDGLVHTFHLREGVTFTNGDAFTAQTAAWSIEQVRTAWTNGLKSQMAPVAATRVLDSHTLEVTLSTPSNRWLWSMGTTTGAMMTPAGVDKRATEPIGTGPYVLDRFAVGESISFAPNPDYWGSAVQEGAAIRYFSDAIGSVNALRSGDVDVVWSLQAPELLDTLPEEYAVQVGTTNGEVVLSMNNDAAPFDDPRVRRAVAYGVDRAAVNQVVWEGLASDTGGAPVPPSDPWFTGRDYYPFDPGKARALLADAGYTPDNRPRVEMTVPSLPYAENAAELLYSQLRDLGFDVKLTTAEFPAVWLADVMGAQDYQMSLISHVEPRDVPALFGDPDYYLGFDDARVREELRLADVTPGPAAERSHMITAVDGIMADAGALTLVNAPNIVLTAPGVTGVDANIVVDSLPLAPIRKED